MDFFNKEESIKTVEYKNKQINKYLGKERP